LEDARTLHQILFVTTKMLALLTYVIQFKDAFTYKLSATMLFNALLTLAILPLALAFLLQMTLCATIPRLAQMTSVSSLLDALTFVTMGYAMTKIAALSTSVTKPLESVLMSHWTAKMISSVLMTVALRVNAQILQTTPTATMVLTAQEIPAM